MKKLSVRKETTLFKKPSSSLYKERAATVLKKAFELSELCGVDVCIIWYDREGNLVKTWPENEEAKVRAMAERFSMLSGQEKNKKSTNLSGFLNKKMMNDKRESLRKKDNRFSEKVSEFKDSLRSRFQTLQESRLLLDQQQPKETTSSVVSTDVSSNHPSTTTMSIMKVGTFGIICCYLLLHLSLTKTLVARFDLKVLGSGERYCWLRQNV
ncbi:hypothetical protein N665_0304s0025 [Sinapis alba]|nr:hypothetical protein N665_0304s0025 [Sinapis alba]